VAQMEALRRRPELLAAALEEMGVGNNQDKVG
jgi:hypothetical protein